MTPFVLFLIFGPVPLMLALGLSIAGLSAQRPGLLFLGGILAAPPALFLGGHPGFWPVVCLPVLHFVAGVAAGKGRPAWAVALLVPTAVALVVFIYVSLR